MLGVMITITEDYPAANEFRFSAEYKNALDIDEFLLFMRLILWHHDMLTQINIALSSFIHLINLSLSSHNV